MALGAHPWQGSGQRRNACLHPRRSAHRASLDELLASAEHAQQLKSPFPRAHPPQLHPRHSQQHHSPQQQQQQGAQQGMHAGQGGPEAPQVPGMDLQQRGTAAGWDFRQPASPVQSSPPAHASPR